MTILDTSDILKLGMKNIKMMHLYSLADWRSHNNKLGYDDLVDKNGNLIVTVNVMDLAKEELLKDSYTEDGIPHKIFILERDNNWSIYVKVRWLTPEIIKQVLGAFGGLAGKKFKFEPHVLPTKLIKRYQKTISQWEQNRIAETLKDIKRLRKKKGYKHSRVSPGKVPDRRLVQLMTHKMKF